MTGQGCTPLDVRHACALESYPVFTEDCSEWEGRRVTHARTRDFSALRCDLKVMSHAHIARLLNNSAVFFVGDSTSRRAARQLEATMLNSKFNDGKARETRAALVRTAHAEFLLVNHWLPKVDYLERSLLGASDATTVPHVFTGPDGTWHDHRKLIVLHYSTWNLLGVFSEPYSDFSRQQAVPTFVTNVSRTLARVKVAEGVNPHRDVVVFRLPIAQGCSGEHRSPCNETSGEDAVNDVVAYTKDLMVSQLSTDHPDVALVDCFSWTRAPQGQVGRHKCAVADAKGTHFGTDVARMAYVHQVLHAAELFSCDKPGWAG
jgi:hypothetical protein